MEACCYSNICIWCWDIPLHKAMIVVHHTMQYVVKNIVNLTLLCRFCTNDWTLLHHTIFTTISDSTISWRCSKGAQIFSSDFELSLAYPMKKEDKAHSALSLMFQHEGVPPLMFMDGSKEQTLGKSHQKLWVAICKKKTSGPHSPWQNTANQQTKEPKKGAGWILLSKTWGH